MGQRCTWQAVSSITHIQPTHKYLRAVLMPASLLGTALGPEGPHCRRRMGGWGSQAQRRRRRGQRERQVRGRDEREQERQWWHSVLNVTTVLKTPANLLAGNERTGGEGGKEGGEETTGRQRWREKESDGKGENEEQKEEEGGSCLGVSEWVGGWVRGGAIDGKDERDGGKQQQHSLMCLHDTWW